ncbi:MAG: hypothetical protein LJE69_14890 [Thiohalocapsa sp.]|uniref:hypothetical protein n=1 Tax=Thiohalocapsa sp. TaxID=2497641 RepID=UPI0025F1645E|nr:hypothetical protein [Thiohalocapsa sp.]MCG6942523.1 hypothetical protein [Thiohalocapsa sp.]
MGMTGMLVRLAPAAAARVVFYVDADNQSPQCAGDLISLFGAAQVLAALRTLCTSDAAGLYSATVVEQGLAKLGFDPKARRAFLASAPGIQTEGKFTGKAYRF